MTARKSSTFSLIALATAAPRADQIEFGFRRRSGQNLAHRLNASDKAFIDGLGVSIRRLHHVCEPHVNDARALVRGIGQGRPDIHQRFARFVV